MLSWRSPSQMIRTRAPIRVAAAAPCHRQGRRTHEAEASTGLPGEQTTRGACAPLLHDGRGRERGRHHPDQRASEPLVAPSRPANAPSLKTMSPCRPPPSRPGRTHPICARTAVTYDRLLVSSRGGLDWYASACASTGTSWRAIRTAGKAGNMFTRRPTRATNAWVRPGLRRALAGISEARR